MAKLTKFTISPSGNLVYKTTGKLAPPNYIFRKSTVYRVDADGVRRRVGSLSRKLTKKEAAKIAKAEKSRERRTARSAAPKRPSEKRPRQPSKTQKAGTMKYGEDWDSFEDSDFPEYSNNVKEEFAQRVRDAALSVAPPWLQARIQALSTEAIWQAWLEDQYIFETYFKYHDPYSAPQKTNISLWLYQFILRIEQYMGVKT